MAEKAKTPPLSQDAAIVLALIAASEPHDWWVQVLVYCTVAITLASGANYFLNFRRRIEEARDRVALGAAERKAQGAER